MRIKPDQESLMLLILCWSQTEVLKLFWFFLLPWLLVTLQQLYFPWIFSRVFFPIQGSLKRSSLLQRRRLMWCPSVVEFLCQLWDPLSLLEIIFKFMWSFCPSWTTLHAFHRVLMFGFSFFVDPQVSFSKDTSDCLQIVMKIIYFLMGGFLMRWSDFSLVGNIMVNHWEIR